MQMARIQKRMWSVSCEITVLLLCICALVVASTNTHATISRECVAPNADKIVAAPLTLPTIRPRVLVTGAAGFIGSHVAAYCATELNFTVIGIDDLSGGFLSNVHPQVQFLQGSIQNETFIHQVFTEHGPFHSIYHLAAYAAEGMSHFIRLFNYRNNLVGSMVLINEAIRTNVSVFVFTSSIAAYGNIPPPMRETDQPIPDDPYGVSKYAVEMDLRTAATMFPPLKFVIFRPHNVYGPHQNVVDRYRNVLGIFISHIMRNLSLPIFGNGQQTRAFTYIDDVAPIIASAPFVLEAHNQVFNLGSDHPHNLYDLATIISEEMNHPLNITYLPARHEVVHAHSDHSRVQCVFGLRQPVDLRSGIRKVIEWIRQRTESFVPVEFNEVEVLRNMPPSWVTDKLVHNYQNRYEQNQQPSPSPQSHDQNNIHATIHDHHQHPHNDL